MDRRGFVQRTAQGAAALGCGAFAGWALIEQQARAAAPLRPPGALAGGDFAARCIKCGQCVRACPYGTLHLVKAGEAGIAGTPTFVPRQAPCVMCEQVWCVQACPSGALDSKLTDIRQAKMGLAVVDPEHCLSWQGLRCEVCVRVCPAQGAAITIANHPRQTSKHAMFVPAVHSEACTGCGVCESKCPTEVAAIRIVDPQLVQGRIGAHYRLAVDAPGAAVHAAESAAAARSAQSAAAARSADGPAAPRSGAPGPAPAPPSGLDYLNRGAGR
ncbi:MAG: MauM/NapG family ferredoxin-type protein [Rubrivivax sp.]|nr:MauM/NapG family ferredoxin-type protein [Rubrivivax sp.]